VRSIIPQDPNRCYLCGEAADWRGMHEHHVFGRANRKISEKYGLKVRVCANCHDRVHADSEERESLQAKLQTIAMKVYNWTVEDFRKIFGKSYV
jgi:sulfur relay (sulfurtransferase) complex TusBCD TusD component (DsrE family)